MNKALLFITIFSFGYVMNDILREANIKLVDKVNAEVAGMSKYQLKYDWDFKGAVEDIVEDCSVDGEDISC